MRNYLMICGNSPSRLRLSHSAEADLVQIRLRPFQESAVDLWQVSFFLFASLREIEHFNSLVRTCQLNS